MDNTNNQSMPATPTTDAQDIEKNKIYGVLAYIGILFIVPLVAAKDSKFAKFHANQGLVVFLMGFAVGFLNIFSGFLLPDLISCFMIPLYFVPIVFSILGIINALNGKMERLPVIGTIELIK